MSYLDKNFLVKICISFKFTKCEYIIMQKMLQKKTIKELTKEAAKIRADLQDYMDDLKMYSNPEFWEAINESETNKGKKISSIKEFLAELKK